MVILKYGFLNIETKLEIPPISIGEKKSKIINTKSLKICALPASHCSACNQYTIVSSDPCHRYRISDIP